MSGRCSNATRQLLSQGWGQFASNSGNGDSSALKNYKSQTMKRLIPSRLCGYYISFILHFKCMQGHQACTVHVNPLNNVEDMHFVFNQVIEIQTAQLDWNLRKIIQNLKSEFFPLNYIFLCFVVSLIMFVQQLSYRRVHKPCKDDPQGYYYYFIQCLLKCVCCSSRCFQATKKTVDSCILHENYQNSCNIFLTTSCKLVLLVNGLSTVLTCLILIIVIIMIMLSLSPL